MMTAGVHSPAFARRWNAVVAFLMLFGVMGSYALLETARDTLFLARLPAARLPWAYLATAVAVTLVAWVARSAIRGASPLRSALVLAVTAAWMLGLYVVGTRAPLPAYALYASVGVAGTLMIVQTWTLIGIQFTIGEARRLFALIAGGGALGAIAGCALATRVVSARGPLSLIAIAGAVLALSSGAPLLLRGARSRSAASPETSDPPLARVYRTAYARRIFWMVALTAIATTTGDFLFKSSVSTTIPLARLGSFFATYQLAMSVIGLAMQVVVAPLLLRRVGANRMIVALPLLIVGTAIGFALVPGIAASLMMKGVDGALRNSVHRTSTEVLYLPLPVEIRGRVKAVIDGVGQRGAQALASLLVLGALALGAGSVHLAMIVISSAAAGVVVAIGLRQHYVQTFRDQIREGRLEEHAALPQLDLESVESLLAMLNSPNDVRVVAALDTLAAQGKVKLIPSLLLYHPSADVATRTLGLLAASGRRDFLPLTERLLAASDAGLVAEVSRVRAEFVGDEDELRRLASDVRAPVRAAGLVGLMRLGAATAEDEKQLQRFATKGSRAEQLQLLSVIARLPHAGLIPTLDEIARGEDSAVQTAVLRALQACADPRCLPIALRLLGTRETREAARKVLVDGGAQGLDLLARAFGDPSIDAEIRRHIPRTLSRFGNERAAAILLEGLTRSDLDAVTRYKALRGLGRMKRDRPTLRLDRTALRRLAHQAAGRTASLRRWRSALSGIVATTSGTLLKALVVRKERMAVERLFRALDLLRPGGEMERIHDELRHPDAGRRATSRELLEHLVDPLLRREVLALVDTYVGDHTGAEMTLADCLQAMHRDHSSAVRALAAEFAAELGMEEVRRAC
ncbi:MAG: lyase domain protein repeat-containing protein [Myxococcales bacterium]|nr:lyase domain protein repeat-containing protein [Myxococcales bacterium]